MRYTVCFVLLVPILALAAGPTRFSIGRVDTVGGTTYDWQFSGPCWRTLVHSPGHGAYVVWMYSTSTSGSSFPDRNLRLNFYDANAQTWAYLDTSDFMSSGVNVFSKRSGYGGIDADTSGTPYISGHAVLGGATRPWVARGQSGDCSDSTLPTCMWPSIAVGRNGAVHILPMTNSYDLIYCRIAPDSWPHWSTPVTGISPSPGFPSHNLAASKVSDHVSLVWEVGVSNAAYAMHSTDAGVTWGNPAELSLPDAYGDDTVTGFHITSLFPYYDRHDRFHIAATLIPVVHDTALVVPAQIWHYCPDNMPQWSRVHVAGCSPANMRGTLGINATYACRPTLGEDQAGVLYVAWEQFDSLNVEPATSRLRADIFLAQDNGDNGATWQTGTRITDQGTWTCRFPSAIDYCEDDSFRVAYMIDQQAGFYAGSPGEGSATTNPVVVHKVPVTVGMAEGRGPMLPHLGLSVAPNPFGSKTTVICQIGRAGSTALTVHDVTGRPVRRLAAGPHPAGTLSIAWDGRDDHGRLLPAGIYFCTLESGVQSTSHKVVMTD